MNWMGINMEAASLREAIVKWLASHLAMTRKSGYVIGVSGGIDSAVAALLANDACRSAGGSFCPVCLPITIDGCKDGRDMRVFFSGYGISAEYFDLSSSFSAFLQDFPVRADPFMMATIKHRFRMIVVYTLAKDRNMLVISTLNKIEFSTGYFPKHAGLGDVLPLADMRKADIRNIARLYGVPDILALRKASGCIHGKTAEDEWGFSEDDGDVLVTHLEASLPAGDISKEKQARFSAMRADTWHKREFPPKFTVIPDRPDQ